MIDQENAVQNGLQAYADGLVRVFQNGQALGNLDEGIQVEEDDHFILLRLVFLRGCLWVMGKGEVMERNKTNLNMDKVEDMRVRAQTISGQDGGLALKISNAA